MRTIDNTLSAWQIDTKEDLPKAVLAIASTGDKAETMDFVVLSVGNLQEKGLAVKHTQTGTAIQEMNDRHYDIIDLTYSSLGKMATIIWGVVRVNEEARIPRQEMKKLFMSAIAENRLDPNKLNEKLQQDLQLVPPPAGA